MNIITEALPREAGAVQHYRMWIATSPETDKHLTNRTDMERHALHVEATGNRLFEFAYTEDEFARFCHRVRPAEFIDDVEQRNGNIVAEPQTNPESLRAFALHRRHQVPASWVDVDKLEDEMLHRLATLRAHKQRIGFQFLKMAEAEIYFNQK